MAASLGTWSRGRGWRDVVISRTTFPGFFLIYSLPSLPVLKGAARNSIYIPVLFFSALPMVVGFFWGGVNYYSFSGVLRGNRIRIIYFLKHLSVYHVPCTLECLTHLSLNLRVPGLLNIKEIKN